MTIGRKTAGRVRREDDCFRCYRIGRAAPVARVPYTTRHGDELQTRLDNVTATSAAHRETITRELRQYDIGMSAETRAMRAALAAEQERKQHATHVPDNR